MTDPNNVHSDADDSGLFPQDDWGDGVIIRYPRLKRALKVLLGVAVLMAALLGWAYYTTQCEPDFYRQINQVSRSELGRAGEQFESKAIESHNNASTPGTWKSVFLEKEINGWLAVGCPKDFPELIPAHVENPRIRIHDAEMKLGFRFRSRRFSPFITFVGDLFVAEPSGNPAIRIKSSKMGIIPLPISRFADLVTHHLRQSNIGVTWQEMDGDPVAVLDIPDPQMVFGDQLFHIDSISCREQELEVVGTSAPVDTTGWDDPTPAPTAESLGAGN